jgi:hypothetical protein
MNLRRDKKIVHIGIALDESGSMSSLKRETLSGLNEQIQALRKHSDVSSTLTLVTFEGADEVKVRYSVIPIEEMKDLTDEDYNPDGMTAMYDGVGKLLNEMSKIEDTEESTYVILVVSDGAENASMEFNSAKIADMIKERQDTKRWTINYIGANQDLSVVQQTLGLNSGNSLCFMASAAGTSNMWATNATCLSGYMSQRASYTTSHLVSNDQLSKNFYGTTGASATVVDPSKSSILN